LAQVGALIWLRFRLLLARAGAGVGSVVFRGVSFLFIMGGALSLYFVLMVLFRGLPAPAAVEVLYAALAAVWGMWIVAPLAGMSFDDSTDLSKLLLYPMTPGRMTAGVLLSDLVSSPAGFTILLAVPAGWVRHLADAPLIVGAIVLLAVHMAALVESMRIVLWDLLRSRRTRDLLILLTPLLFIVFYAVYGLVLRGAAFEHWARWLNLHPSAYLRFLPSGLAAGAAVGAAAASYGASLAYLGGLLALAAATVWLMAVLVRRVQAGEAESGHATPSSTEAGLRGPRRRKRARRDHARQRSRERQDGRAVWGPREVRATSGEVARRWPVSSAVTTVARKELVLFWRNPHLKTQIIQAVAFPIAWLVFMGFWSLGDLGGGRMTPGLLVAVIGLMLFGSFALSANSFGFEGAAAETLFLFPSSRRALLAGKNLALWAALMALYAPALVLLAALARQWATLPLALIGTGAALALELGVGNFLAIYVPYRLPSKRKNPLAMGSRGPGCVGMVLITAAFAGAMVVALPAAAALILPMALHGSAWYWLTVPASAAYVWWLYRLLLDAAAGRLLQREPEIIQAVGKGET
jgi:hypothetical protein